MVTVRNAVATQPRNFMLKESAAYLGLRNNQGEQEEVRAPKKKHFRSPPPPQSKGRATNLHNQS